MQIEVYLCNCNQITSWQPLNGGFLEGRSTVTALIKCTDDWLKSLDGNDMCAIFFDYRKAFDSVPHRTLIVKLWPLAVDDCIINWVKNYYLPALCWKVSSSCSWWSGIGSLASPFWGPQGSVLGPPLPDIPLQLFGSALEGVNSGYTYLGVLLSYDLSWSLHVEFACQKALWVLSLLYRRFYDQASQESLKQLYLAISISCTISNHLEMLSSGHLMLVAKGPGWCEATSYNIKDL